MPFPHSLHLYVLPLPCRRLRTERYRNGASGAQRSPSLSGEDDATAAAVTATEATSDGSALAEIFPVSSGQSLLRATATEAPSGGWRGPGPSSSDLSGGWFGSDIAVVPLTQSIPATLVRRPNPVARCCCAVVGTIVQPGRLLEPT